MRLLFVSNLFPDSQEPYRGLDNATLLHALAGRAEIHTLALRPALPWSRRSWTARPEDAPLRPQFSPVAYIPRFGHRWNHLLYARSIRQVFGELLRQSPPFDAVLASWLFPDACAVARLLAETSTRFVAIAQGTDAHHYLRIPARRKIITRELQRADAIITRSAELARLLQTAGLPEARLHPVYNGVDLERFRPARAGEKDAARQALGIPPEAPLILYVGNFLPVKNPGMLLEAHARLLKTPGLEQTRLLLVGGGPLEPALRAQAQRGAADRVVFRGRMDASGVAEAMRAADVLALSSWNEGVPNVILEAFASGLPVVATRVGGIAEVLTSERFGILSPAGDAGAFTDALRDALTGKRDPQEIAARGSAFIWNRTASEYLRHLSAGD